MLFELLSFLVAAFAFEFGAVRLFRKKIPLYFQHYVCAAGCFALERLFTVVTLWCGVSEPFGIGMLGIFGCHFFLFSANYGTLDRIVDDGTGNKKAKSLAFLAPVVAAVFMLTAFFIRKEQDPFGAVLRAVLLLPALPASYYNLKHLLLPPDPFGCLAATKACNLSALCLYGTIIAGDLAEIFAKGAISGAFSVLTSLAAALLAFSAVRGVKKWGI